MAKDLNRHVFKGDTQMTNKAPQEVLNISSHYGTTNQNHSEVPLSTL